MMEKLENSKWKVTLKFERGDGKIYSKQISSNATKAMIYITFVAALWTTSAYVYFYFIKDQKVRTSAATHFLNQTAQPEEIKAPEQTTVSEKANL